MSAISELITDKYRKLDLSEQAIAFLAEQELAYLGVAATETHIETIEDRQPETSA